MTLALHTLSAAMTTNKTRMAEKAHEVATGRPKDLARSLGANLQTYTNIGAEVSRNTSLSTVTAQASLKFDAQSSALERFFQPIQALTERMIAQRSAPGEANGAFLDMTSALNTAYAGQSLFSGTSTDRPAIGDPAALLAGAKAVFAAAADTASGVDAVLDFFRSDTGGYASSVVATLPTSGEVVGAAFTQSRLATALDPALRTGLAGAALAAIAKDTGSGEVARSAMQTLTQASGEGVELRARIGTQSAHLDRAAQNFTAQAEAGVMDQKRMEGIDPYQSAVELIQLQTQAEQIYLMTARLSKLSLVNYLR